MGTSLNVLIRGRFANDIGEVDILRDADRCRVARAILLPRAGASKERRTIGFLCTATCNKEAGSRRVSYFPWIVSKSLIQSVEVIERGR